MPDEQRPWLSQYEAGVPETLAPSCSSVVALFEQALTRDPADPQMHYFDEPISRAHTLAWSNALASGLHRHGLRVDDRVALCLQNVPQFMIALLGCWRSGLTVVPCNPMLRSDELGFLLRDATVQATVALQSLQLEVVDAALAKADLGGRVVSITTSELDFLGESAAPPLLAGSRRQPCEGSVDLVELLRGMKAERGPHAPLRRDTLAALVYTSGTTGAPKGAMVTHGNMVHSVEAQRAWARLEGGGPVLAVAPLFHITGLVMYGAASLGISGMPAVLTYRFEPATTAQAAERHSATYTVAAITAYIALLNAEGVVAAQLGSLRTLFSGGAPIAPATITAFAAKFGRTIRAAYGLTETASASHLTPRGAPSPVDAASGALTVGVPICGVHSRIVAADGRTAAAGEVGEIAISGASVVPGYWRKPQESAEAFPGRELRTGDVGLMDAAGWFYIVDRKKDMIIASGFKVWPREVEDALYTHPAVREAAVVGIPDAYRGESVKAYVSLVPAAPPPTAVELIAHCRERLAAYKRPHALEFLDELPKTATGKIMRRVLAKRAADEAAAAGLDGEHVPPIASRL